MITSTAHFDEVRHLLDQTLALMGLSGSMRNCEYLLGQLKGLSGRLAMRLAAGGTDLPAKRIGAELVALSLVRANCLKCIPESECWLPLSNGFLVPLDDVRDLAPLVKADEDATDLVNDDDAPHQGDSRRADMLFVSVVPKGRLQFRFAEVKYRRHLAMARASALVTSVLEQTSSTRTRWMDWFFGEALKPSERAIRAGRLVRALSFYADKARRHHLEESVYNRVCEELDRFLRESTTYQPNLAERSDRAFIFCPDFSPTAPEELFPGLTEECRVWLFGPDTLPDKPHESSYAAASQAIATLVFSTLQARRFLRCMLAAAKPFNVLTQVLSFIAFIKTCSAVVAQTESLMLLFSTKHTALRNLSSYPQWRKSVANMVLP